MADYLKLLDKGAGMIGLDDELELIKALAEIGKSWRELLDQAKKIDGAESAQALLAAIVANVDDSKLDPLFDKLPGAREKLKGLLTKIGDLKDKIPEKYWKLLEPLSTYEGGEDGKVDWALSGGKDAQLGSKVKLGVKGEAKLQLDAAAKAKIGETELKPLLRMGVEGNVKANANGELPIQWGKLTGSVEASVDVGLDYYFDPELSTELYGVAVGKRIIGLPDPFDFDGVWEAFQTHDLAGIVYRFNDHAKAKVDVAIGASGDFGEKVLAEAKLSLGASVSTDNKFQLSLRGLKKQGQARPVEIILARSESKEAGLNVEAGIEVKFDASVVRLREILNKAVEKSDKVLSQITPYLTPGTWLREHFNEELDAAAKKLLGDAELGGLRKALIADIKSVVAAEEPGEPALTALLSEKLTGAIDDAAKELTGLGDKAREEIIDKVAKALPGAVGEQAAAALREKTKDAIGELIGKVTAPFEKKLGELVALPDRALGKALKKANAAVDDKIKTVDEALAPVRKLIDEYNKLLHKVQTYANDEARTRIAAKLKLAESWTLGEEERIVGTFDAATDDAGKIFDQITRGDVEALKLLLLDVIAGTPAPVPGFTLGGDSQIKYTARRSSEASFELIALGFGESGNVKLDGSADVMIDANGKVQVDAEGSLKERFKTGSEEREVSFVDTLSLIAAKTAAAAGETRTIDMGVSISHIDKSLKLDELKGFVDSLAKAGMVSTDTTAAAETQFRAWSPEGKKIKADIGANFALSHDRVRTFMRLDQRQNGQLPEPVKRELIATAIAAAKSLGMKRANIEHGAASVANEFDKTARPLPDFLLDRIKEADGEFDFTKLLQKGDLTDPDLKAFLAEYRRMLGLIGLVQKLGDIYEAVPQVAGPPIPGAWSVQRYAKEEHLVANYSGRWLETGGGFWRISAEVAPVTVLFLATICDLVGIQRLVDGKPRKEGLDIMDLSFSRRSEDGESIAEKVVLTQPRVVAIV